MALTEAINYNPLDDIKQRQLIQEKAMQLQDMKRLMDEAAQGRALEQQYANMPMPGQEQAQMAPPKMMQMQAPQYTAPSGAPAPSFMAGPQQEAMGKQMVNVESPVYQAKKSAVELAGMQDRLTQAKTIEQEMRKRGLIDYADKYAQRHARLAEDFEDAKLKHLQNVSKTFEAAANIANGYLETRAKGGNPDEAWSELVRQSVEAGVGSAEKLMSIPPQFRNQYAFQVREAAETSKDRAIAERDAAKELSRDRRAAMRDKTTRMIADLRLKQQARQQAAIQSRHEDTMGLRSLSIQQNNIKSIREQTNKDRSNIENEIKQTEAIMKDVRNINAVINPVTNMPFDSDDSKPGSRKDALDTLQDKIESLRVEKENLDTELDGYNRQLRDLGDKAGVSGKPTKDDVKLVVEAINSNKTKAAYEKIKSNFERMHPGYKLEEFVKFDTKKLK